MGETIRVLYAEDEADIREVAEFALEDEGFELLQCATGQEAVEQAQQGVFDLLLLDVMMPVLDGPAALSKIRELPHMANTPAIFMTAKVQPAEVEQYRKLGAIGVIAKPFDAMSLADEIRALLESDND